MGVPGGGESVGRNQDHLNISWGHTRAFPVANTHLHTTNTLPDIDILISFRNSIHVKYNFIYQVAFAVT